MNLFLARASEVLVLCVLLLSRALPLGERRRLRLKGVALLFPLARACCGQCGHDFLIAYSCKNRGVCPACNARRMAETAPHLAVHVFPRAPVRQWVLSVPKRVRYFLQKDSAVEILARHIFLSAVEQGLRARSSAAGSISRIGAVAFIHRFGALLIAHVHFHCVVIEGVFEAEAIGGVRFHKAQGVGAETVAEVQAKLSRRVLRALARRGLLEREERRRWAPGITPGPAALATAAVALGGSACQLAWPVCSTGIVSAGYGGLGPQIFQKDEQGRRISAATVVLGAYLFAAWLNAKIFRWLKAVPPPVELRDLTLWPWPWPVTAEDGVACVENCPHFGLRPRHTGLCPGSTSCCPRWPA